VFVPLQAGASLHIPPASALREPGELLGWLAAERITVAHVTPPLIRLLAGAGQGHGLPALRLVVSGGDTLRGTDVATLRALAPEATVLNAYGTTETPQIVAWQRIPPGLPWASGPDAVPIGTGLDGFDLDIARADGQPADVGELGLLIVRSPYLSREYLARGEFASGDLGRRLPDGRLALAGRADRQVQVRGFRVDPAGLDLAVRALPGIADCVTVPRTGPDGETALVVYAVPAPGQDVSPGRLRDGLKSALPAHMLPAGLVTLARLPLTPNGKIDTAALPAWAPGGPAPGHDPAEAPATALEKLIASVWREVLRTEDISASASFFDLGGSSLLMATAGQRLTRELGRPVAVLTLFEHPTVRALAAHLEGSQGQAGPAPARRRLVTADAERRRAIRQEISVSW
jgi:acyl-coenzyme A synthetase/AMP-(fatty) acid ligase